jgi:ubiquinone/menaquinone biosynthesis C-methylase UbiE
LAVRWNLMVAIVLASSLLNPVFPACSAQERPKSIGQHGVAETPCRVLADRRLEQPLEAIVGEYRRRTGAEVDLSFLPAAELNARLANGPPGCDVVLSLPAADDGETAVGSLPQAKKVAWKHPSGEPVWAAALSEHPQAADLVRFLGGPTGHRLWAESEAGFTITSGKTRAEAFEWVVRHRTGHTYPITATRMLRECGGIGEGICIEVGCGSGDLAVELAKRSKLTIIGLDIDPDVKPLFESKIRRAGLEDRVSFVLGDAQQLPFPDDYADLIVSRGTLIFIPDIGQCLREVDRVLKPTGVAFLGGRYVYTPQVHKISTEALKKIVRETGIPDAEVIDARGQWVKIIGPKAPKAARQFQSGPTMLADRFVADYAISRGKCLLICRSDGPLEQSLQQGFVDVTELDVTALYPSVAVANEAAKRIRAAKLAGRITCQTGDVGALPFEEASFDAVAGVGPILLWGDRETAMREIYRVLRPGGAALIGGRYVHMPEARKVSNETLRNSALNIGVRSIRVYDDMGQWVEIRKGIQDRGFRD